MSAKVGSKTLPLTPRPVIETAEQRFLPQADRMWRLTEKPAPHLWPLLLGPRRNDPVMPKGDLARPKVKVRANHGVWQTLCPYCPSAQHASITDPRFYCADCQNAANKHRTLPVIWPDNVEEIDAQLALRPRKEFRNWEPDETIEDLQQQDEEAIATLG